MVLSFVGVVLVIAAGVGIELTGSPIGFALTMAAALCWATYTAFGAKVLRRHSPLVLTTWATIGGDARPRARWDLGQLLAPGALGPEQAAALPSIIFAVAFSGLLAAALANVVVFQGVGLLGPTRVMTLQSLVPAMAVVLAFIFLHEPIRPVQIVGGAMIILGVASHAAGPRAGRSARPVMHEIGPGRSPGDPPRRRCGQRRTASRRSPS